MKFEFIENSLMVNKDQDPSVFLALCLLETVFKDFKNESGEELSELTVGDETWPLKLSLIYRKLESIYSAHKDEIVRAPKQLEELSVESGKITDELEANGGVFVEIRELKKTVDEKKATLESAKQEQRNLSKQSEFLNGQINELQDEVRLLKEQCDEEEKIRQRDRLLNEKARLEEELASREKEIEDTKRQISELQERIEPLRTECASLESSSETLRKQEIEYIEIKKRFSDLSFDQRIRLIERYKKQIEIINSSADELREAIITICNATGKPVNGQQDISVLLENINDFDSMIDSLIDRMKKISEIIKSEVI